MGARYKILLFESMHEQGTSLLAEQAELVYAQNFDQSYLNELARDVDGLVIRANGAVTEELIAGAKKLKVIGRHGVGLDGIDLDAAKRHGVKVVYTPTANTQSVAEHFVGLAVMLAKKINLAESALLENRWQDRYKLIGTELRGKTLGVLGFGRIGQATARICRHGFGMPVIYYDVIAFSEAEKELGAVRMEMADVFRQADFISINLPLLPSTRQCVNAGMIGLMKPGAFLINMARGPLWNEEDLFSALKERCIAGAGSDVFEVEPIRPDNPLLTLDNFIGTPHMSAHTEEAMIAMSMVARDMLAVLERRTPEFPVPGV